MKKDEKAPFRKISDPISVASSDFQFDCYFFSEVRFLSDQKRYKVMGLKFMGKLTDFFLKCLSSEKKTIWFFFSKFVWSPCTHLPPA